MRNNLTLKKIAAQRRNEKKRIIRNALRGAARPWTLEKAQSLFLSHSCPREKLRLFHLYIGNIFPLILDMIATGHTINGVERQMGLTPRMLWRWLVLREELMDKVREARGLRGRVGVGVDVAETPLARRLIG